SCSDLLRVLCNPEQYSDTDKFVSLTRFQILRLGKMQIKIAFALGLFVSLQNSGERCEQA
uniref:hypothetical protein n=1 Tax=Alistipes putredinis TaxID=28117 RepID=UPI003FD89AAD